jgi:hypothetical protein
MRSTEMPKTCPTRPALPIDITDPIDPIDKNDPAEPIESAEATEPTLANENALSRDPADKAAATQPTLRTDAIEWAERDETIDRTLAWDL